MNRASAKARANANANAIARQRKSFLNLIATYNKSVVNNFITTKNMKGGIFPINYVRTPRQLYNLKNALNKIKKNLNNLKNSNKNKIT